MPRYVSSVDRLIGHESLIVKAGVPFVTTFPKVKTKDKDGKVIEVDMRLGENLKRLADEPKGEAKDLG